MSRPWLKSTLIGIAVLVVWSPLLEWAARAMVRAYGDSLQAARLVLQPDDRLGWRQRSALDTTFRGKSLKTDLMGLRDVPPSAGKARVWVLGPSSSFGWGVGQGETYSDDLEKRLGVPVFNAGEIGYSIVQGEKLYARLQERLGKPAPFVVLAYGINDIDHFRFFGKNGPSDDEVFEKGDWGSPLLNRFALTALFVRSWQETSIYRECGMPMAPELRVSPAEFEARLDAFTERIARDGSVAVLLNTAFAPKNAPAGSPDESDRLYARSALASREGRCAESRKLLWRARALETQRILRDVKRINQAVSEVAAKKKLPLLDLAAMMRPEDFVDPVHFSVTGNKKIADALLRITGPGGPRVSPTPRQ